MRGLPRGGTAVVQGYTTQTWSRRRGRCVARSAGRVALAPGLTPCAPLSWSLERSGAHERWKQAVHTTPPARHGAPPWRAWCSPWRVVKASCACALSVCCLRISSRRACAAPHAVGRSHPTIGVLEHPFETGVFTGPDVQAVYQTDGHGFRNPSPWPPAAELVVVGDGVAFGYGVEDAQAWPALLAQWLAPQRVRNLGLVDASPQQYLRVYETFESALHPRMVLVGLSLATDFEDAELL